MNGRFVACPSCGTLLDAPPTAADCLVRCGKCKSRFRLPKKVAVTGSTIASWLWEDRDTEEAPEGVQSAAEAAADPRHESVMFLAGPNEEDMPPIRLVRLGSEGALFEFPASRLKDPEFRLSMPRMCVRCNSRTSLSAHVIIYTPELTDSLSLEAERLAGRLQLSSSEVRGLSQQQLLDRLPLVPNVPAPADLPMLYWMCDACHGSGMISGQINVNRETERGWCRLRIRSLPVAERFLINIGRGDTAEHAEIEMRMRAQQQHPWEHLPHTVRGRIEQWFTPQGDEQFVAYIPDRDRVPTEDGMYGLLVSDRRLIYHCQYRHHETDQAMPIYCQWSQSGPKCRLQIRTPGWHVTKFHADHEGIETLRKAMRKAGFHVRWM